MNSGPTWAQAADGSEARGIARERIDRGERLHLLSDDSIEPDSGEIDHRWREDVAFLDTRGLALRKRPQKNAIEHIRSYLEGHLGNVSNFEMI